MNLYNLLLPFCIALFGYFLLPKLIELAQKWQYLDEAKGRKRHKASIPPIGGWLIFAAFTLGYLSFTLIPTFNLENLSVFISFLALFALGLVDDKFPMNAAQKFTGQFIIAAILVFVGNVHFDSFLEMYGLPPILSKLLTMVFIVFIINAYNLIDGINGLAAMLGILALGFLGSFLFKAGNTSFLLLALSVIAALLVFLRYNLIQTRVFLGDNGSMLIGLTAAYLAIHFIKIQTEPNILFQNNFQAPIGIALACLLIPIADTLRLFVLRPFYLAKSPFKADRNHLHHLLLRLGLQHAQASFVIVGLGSLLVLAALAAQDLGSIAIFFILASILLAFMMSLDYLVFSKYRRNSQKRTLFNSFQNISKSLNYPQFFEFIFVISFFLLAIAIPFHRVSTSIPTLILIFSIATLFLRNFFLYKNSYWKDFSKKMVVFLKHPYTVLLLIYLVFVGLHTIFIKESSWTKYSIYALLLVYWLAVYQLKNITPLQPRVLLSAYIAGCAGFAFFIVANSFVLFPSQGWEGFFNAALLKSVKANPVTHSLYYNLAIIFLGNNYKFLKQNAWKFSFWILLIFFTFFVMLCASKIGYVALVMSFSFTFYKFINNRKIAFSIISLSLLGILLVAYYYQFLSAEYWQQAFAIRNVVWQETGKLIQENWKLGVGMNQSVAVLQESFQSIGFTQGLNEKYNAQNQFLESFLELGIAGIVLLLSIISYGFQQAVKHKNVLYLTFLSIITIYMFSESLFQTQMGMVSFAFFNALFLLNLKKNT